MDTRNAQPNRHEERSIAVCPGSRHRAARWLRAIVALAAVALVPVSAFAITKANEGKEAAKDGWEYLSENLGEAMMPLDFDSVPEADYPKIADLAKRAREAMKNDPSIEEIEAFWKRAGRPDMKLEDVFDDVKNYLKHEKFAKANAAAIRDALRGALKAMLQKTAGEGEETKKGVVMICVPLPCPSLPIYNAAAETMDAAAAAAKDNEGKIYLVRSCYGDPDNLKKSEENNWWWRETKTFPSRFEAAIKSGNLKLRDALAGHTSTPWGYLFRDGELIQQGNLATWDKKDLKKEFETH